jgi:hypothetical protein
MSGGHAADGFDFVASQATADSQKMVGMCADIVITDRPGTIAVGTFSVASEIRSALRRGGRAELLGSSSSHAQARSRSVERFARGRPLA